MKRMIGVAVAAACLLAPVAAQAQDRSRAIKAKEARKLAKQAAAQTDGSVAVKRFRADCDRRTRTRFRCRVRWTDGYDRYRGRITIWRTGTRIDSRDRYASRITERKPYCRRCSRRRRGRGMLVDHTRRARLGQALSLLGQDDAYLRVTPRRVIDPVPPAAFEAPPAAGRYVGVELEVENLADTRAEEWFGNAARLVLADGRTLEPGYPAHPSCSVAHAIVPPGGTRVVCVAFEVAPTDALRSLEVTLSSGYGPETGQWRL